MPTWLPRVLRRIRELAAGGRVRFLDADDALDVLRALSGTDLHGRLGSDASGEWMYVFKPTVGELVIYLKVALRDDCIVVSFHEDEEDHDDSA